MLIHAGIKTGNPTSVSSCGISLSGAMTLGERLLALKHVKQFLFISGRNLAQIKRHQLAASLLGVHDFDLLQLNTGIIQEGSNLSFLTVGSSWSILLSKMFEPSLSLLISSVGPNRARMTGKRIRPWNKPNITVKRNTCENIMIKSI